MIWLTWRQHRRQLLATVLGLLVLAAVVLPTGLAMHRDYDRLGLANCVRTTAEGLRPVNGNATCDENWHRFSTAYQSTPTIGVLFVFLPVVIGLFWGAAVVARETEHGTHRLVWTQGVSRRRWGWTKVALLGVAALVLSGLYAAWMSWWFAPLDAIGNSRFMYLTYDVQGLVPVAYTLFAVALGVLAGSLQRRVLPAMAFTLGAYFLIRLPLIILARPNFMPAKHFTYPVVGGQYSGLPLGDWPVYSAIKDATGKTLQVMSEASCSQPCAGFPAGAYNTVLYQPASRYWLFQGVETGIFVALAIGLVLVAVRRLPRIA